MEPGDSAQDLQPEQRCRVCGGSTRRIFEQPVLGRPVRYFDCPRCGYVQTESPYWLTQAYEQPIADIDTGIMLRNSSNLIQVTAALVALRQLRGRVLDIGGGYGILVRMLRDLGVDAYWDDKHCANLLAQGFEREHDGYDLVTAFEVLEHMEHPLEELRSLLRLAPAVLISTELVPRRTALTRDWWYLIPESGQHIGFCRVSTLAWIAQALGCHYATDGRSVHLFVRDALAARRWGRLRKQHRYVMWLARRHLSSRTQDDLAVVRSRLQGVKTAKEVA